MIVAIAIINKIITAVNALGKLNKNPFCSDMTNKHTRRV
jgi:hypothetical protein